MDQIKETMMMWKRWLFLPILFLLSHLTLEGQSQSLSTEVLKLSRWIENPQLRKTIPQDSAVILTRSLTFEEKVDTLDPFGILAAYTYQSKEEALENGTSADAILRNYQNNPYLSSILSQIDTLKNQFNQKEYEATVRFLRGDGKREAILKQLTNANVYANRQMLNAEKLIADYQLPRINDETAFAEASSKIREISSADPASFAANFLSGFADWVSKRTQEELIQTFLLKLQNDLGDKKLNYLFPNSYDYLQDLDVTNYRAILSNARLAFAKDLNTLSLNISNYLTESGNIAAHDSRAFNLLLVYRLIDLAQREFSLPDILGYASGEFSRRRFESEKLLHDNLINTPNPKALEALVATFDSTNQQLKKTFLALVNFEEEIKTMVNEIDFSAFDKFPEQSGKVFFLMDKSETFAYSSFFKNKEGNYLNEIDAFLNGKLDYDVLKTYPSFNQYYETFDNPVPGASELRKIGLSMVRELLRKDDAGYLIVHELESFYEDLRDFESAVETLKILSDTTTVDSVALVDELKETLKNNIQTEQNFWKDDANVEEHLWQAFAYQVALLERIEALPKNTNASEKIGYLQQVERLLAQHTLKLVADYPDFSAQSPYLKKERQKQNTVETTYEALTNNIQACITVLDQLKEALTNLETAGDNQALLQSYRNASTYYGILHSGTQLLYSLAVVPENDKDTLAWLKPNQLSRILNNDLQRQLFLGLLYQRISSITEDLTLDSRGLASIATQMVQQLTVLDTASNNQSKLLSRIELAMGLVNNILETPILPSFTGGSELQTLAGTYPGLKNIPEINRNLLELVQHSDQNNYRYAFNNVLQLIELFDAYPIASKKRGRWQDQISNNESEIARLKAQIQFLTPEDRLFQVRNNEITQLQLANRSLTEKMERFDTTSYAYSKYRNNIFRYGHFLADVAAADSTTAIQKAFQNIAMPKGSSQNKRIRPFSVDLNAYFGGTLAHEFILDDSAVDSENIFNSYGLFVPVGFAFSKKISKNSNYSLSLFVPIIDLGALTAYRIDADDQNNLDILPEVSFANVLSPGAHVFLNFPNTPFFLGGGFQFGPNVREILENDEKTNLRTLRVMFSLGIDIPILSFTN